jgi:hypothetical protein
MLSRTAIAVKILATFFISFLQHGALPGANSAVKASARIAGETGTLWEDPGRSRWVLHAADHIIRSTEALAIHGSRGSAGTELFIF